MSFLGVPIDQLLRSPVFWALGALVLFAVAALFLYGVLHPIQAFRERRSRRESEAALGLKRVRRADEELKRALQGVYGGGRLSRGSLRRILHGSYKGYDVWSLERWTSGSFEDVDVEHLVIVRLPRVHPSLLIRPGGQPSAILVKAAAFFGRRFQPTGHPEFDRRFTLTASRDDPRVIEDVSRIRDTLIAQSEGPKPALAWRVAENPSHRFHQRASYRR